MSFTIQFKRGTTAQNDAHTGPAGSVTIDTEKNELRIHDGVTAGGHVVSDTASIESLQQQIDNLAIADIAGLETALSEKVATSQLGVANGVATLNESGQVPAAQLPSYVDDVIEVADYASLPVTGEAGKIYVTLDSNNVYRWGGSAYLEIAASPGTTDEVAEGATNLYFTVARARAALSVSGDLSYDPSTGIISYTAPVVTKDSIGLGLVENYAIATQVEAEAATSNTAYMTPLRTRNFVEAMGFSQDVDGNWFLDQGTMV